MTRITVFWAILMAAVLSRAKALLIYGISTDFLYTKEKEPQKRQTTKALPQLATEQFATKTPDDIHLSTSIASLAKVCRFYGPK